LIAGRKYAWRVRVIDEEGITSFKNDGYSEVYWFKYGKECKAPELKIEKVEATKVHLRWNPSQLQNEFTIQYKAEKQKDDIWYSYQTDYLSAVISKLKPNTTYIFRINGVCGIQESDFSRPIKATTAEDLYFECGAKAAKESITNYERMMNLVRGDRIQAGDFEVEIHYAEGKNGVFRGKGFVRVPMFGFIKLEADLEDIIVNTDYQLIGGRVRSGYNLNNNLVVSMGDLYNNLNPLMKSDKNPFPEAVDENISINDSIIEIKILGDRIEILTVDGNRKEITLDRGKVIGITAGNQQIVVDSNSNNIYVQSNKDGKSPNKGRNIKEALEGEKKIVVTFENSENSVYGFDKAGDAALAGNYKKGKLGNRDKYISWKSLENGKIDKIKSVIEGESADSVYFSRMSNTMVLSTKAGKSNERELLLTGNGDMEEDVLYAWYTYKLQKNDTVEEDIYYAGEINLVSYEKKRVKVCLVGVNGSVVPEASYVEKELNKIYSQAVVEWEVVTIKEAFNVNLMAGGKKIDNTDVNNKMDYTDEMKKVIREFKKTEVYDKKSYYLFFFDEVVDARIKGYMPLGGRFGFIFKYKQGVYEYIRTIAHELGHGVFHLRHTFSVNNIYQQSQGTTNNLMDYVSADKAHIAIELKKYQWDYIHDPQTILFAWTEEEEEGAMVATSDECWAKGKENWKKYPVHKALNKKKLDCDAICSYQYNHSCDLWRTYYHLVNGNILMETQQFKDNKCTESPEDIILVYHLYIADLNEWFEVDINTFEDNCLSCDLNFIATEITKLVGKTIGRYVLPIEDFYILLEGKDFDGNQSSRVIAGSFLFIEFIPGGKILKPVTKGLKASTKATIKGTRKIYKLVKGTKVVVGEFADDILKPAKWIDGSVDEVIETLDDVSYITKEGKEAKGSVQVVKKGDDIGFRQVLNTIDDFWEKIPAQYRKQVQESFEEGTVQLKYADEELILYRHISQDGAEKSFWYVRTIQSPQNARKFYALPSANNADWVVKVKVKKGTPFIEEKVASQVGNEGFGSYATGGGTQLYFLQEYFDDIQVVEKFVNPIK